MHSCNPIINEGSVASSKGSPIGRKERVENLEEKAQASRKEDCAIEDLSERPEKEVFLQVNSIEVEDKTMKVVNKLRRMSALFEQINRLKFAKQKLHDFKC